MQTPWCLVRRKGFHPRKHTDVCSVVQRGAVCSRCGSYSCAGGGKGMISLQLLNPPALSTSQGHVMTLTWSGSAVFLGAIFHLPSSNTANQCLGGWGGGGDGVCSIRGEEESLTASSASCQCSQQPYTQEGLWCISEKMWELSRADNLPFCMTLQKLPRYSLTRKTTLDLNK